MFLEIVASRLIKRFTDQTKFWDNMIKLSLENTPAHLDPYSIQFAFRHYAYSSRISTPLNLGSDTTPTHLESLLQSIFFFQNYTYSFRFSTPLHSICVPTLHLLIQSLHTTPLVTCNFIPAGLSIIRSLNKNTIIYRP